MLLQVRMGPTLKSTRVTLLLNYLVVLCTTLLVTLRLGNMTGFTIRHVVFNVMEKYKFRRTICWTRRTGTLLTLRLNYVVNGDIRGNVLTLLCPGTNGRLLVFLRVLVKGLWLTLRATLTTGWEVLFTLLWERSIGDLTLMFFRCLRITGIVVLRLDGLTNGTGRCLGKIGV